MKRILIAVTLIALSAALFGGGFAGAAGFTQGDDPMLVLPEVMILIDTSGSMLWGAYAGSSGCTDPDFYYNLNGEGYLWMIAQWGYGSYYYFRCDGYQCVSDGVKCRRFNGSYCQSWGTTPYSHGDQYTCYRNRVEAVREVLTGDYNTCSVGTCCGDQEPNGLLDKYADVIRFGLSTFDANYSSWCYPVGGSRYGIKGRSDGAGKLVDLVYPPDPPNVIANNERVQNEACAMYAPKQNTPIGDAFEDLHHYFGPDSANSRWRTEIIPTYIDPLGHCRGRYIILMSDGQNTLGSDPIQPAKDLCDLEIPVLVVGFGDDNLKTVLDQIAAAGTYNNGPNGCMPASAPPLAAYMADNPQDLKDQFEQIFLAILAGTASRTDSASTPVDLTTDTSYMYGAYFRISETGSGWNGYLVRQKIETSASGEWQWSTDPDVCDGDAQLCFHKELFERPGGWNSRNIYTVAHDPRSQECVADSDCRLPRPLHMTDQQVGLYPFTQAGNGGGVLTGAMCMSDNDAADRVIRHVRGDPNETGQAGPVLGDIFHSSPVVVGPPSALAPDFRYEAHFRMHRKRYTMVYVGANDGMLHAFVAEDHRDDDGGDHEGEELWGFIPNNLLADIQRATDSHEFFVDGSPVVQDVYLRDTPLMNPSNPSQPLVIDGKEITGSYRTVLISGERGGGDAYFALDVTDPQNPQYLWEYRTGVSVVRDYTDLNCKGGKGLQTWAKPIIGQVWVKNKNPTPENPMYIGRSVAIVPGGYMNPASLLNVRSCVEFVEGLVSASSLHVIDIETGKLLRKFMFATGADADNVDKLEAYYTQLASGSTDKWMETFKSDDYSGPGGWGWGSDNVPSDGWFCREDRENIQSPPQLPPELLESCVLVSDDAVKYELNCCWKGGTPVDPTTCNPNAVGGCYYSYIKYKGVLGGVVVKLKGIECKDLLDFEKGKFKLSVGSDFTLESTAATPAGYNTALGEFITRVFVPTTNGVVYRVDLTHAEYDPDADEGEMVVAYTDGDGKVHEWAATKWWPKPPQDNLGRPIQVTPSLAMSYERDLVLFFGTGAVDTLEWSDTQDHLYAVKETRTRNASTGYYEANDTGDWFIDAARSRFTFAQGERLFAKPLVAGGKIFFTTYTPNADECEAGDACMYGMYFDNLFDDMLFKEEEEGSSTPSSPSMLWTPSGPEVVVQTGTTAKVLDRTNMAPASHIVHWGKVL